ncbi:MAG: GntR family transcriptional regulator [Cytophagaceae bacterium]|jgi:predicted RNA-binding protein (virulence factor B family)|nr:GntR family transcriptional regulator [Cytophagaceae bacterium]
MAQIGKLNRLKVLRKVSIGYFLDGDTLGDLLLPMKYAPAELKVGDELNVFVYLDSEERLIATTQQPYAAVGDFAMMKVAAVENVGAFLDWGLVKQLFVPFKEQQIRMKTGETYLVYVYIDDNTQRIVASSKIDKFLDNTPPEYKTGQEVELIIAYKTDLGYKAIINRMHLGVIYHNQIFTQPKIGEKMKGYIGKVREDDKIDLLLQKPGYEKMDEVSAFVFSKLEENNGYLPVNDNTSPEVISRLFKISKKNFKQAIGALYRKKLITIEEKGIRIV